MQTFYLDVNRQYMSLLTAMPASKKFSKKDFHCAGIPHNSPNPAKRKRRKKGREGGERRNENWRIKKGALELWLRVEQYSACLVYTVLPTPFLKFHWQEKKQEWGIVPGEDNTLQWTNPLHNGGSLELVEQPEDLREYMDRTLPREWFCAITGIKTHLTNLTAKTCGSWGAAQWQRACLACKGPGFRL